MYKCAANLKISLKNVFSFLPLGWLYEVKVFNKTTAMYVAVLYCRILLTNLQNFKRSLDIIQQ